METFILLVPKIAKIIAYVFSFLLAIGLILHFIKDKSHIKAKAKNWLSSLGELLAKPFLRFKRKPKEEPEEEFESQVLAEDSQKTDEDKKPRKLDIAKQIGIKEKIVQQKAGKNRICLTWLLFIFLIFIINVFVAGFSVLVLKQFIEFDLSMLYLFIAWVILIACSVLLIFIFCHKSVPHNEEWTIEFFGRWITTWESGLHFLFPFFMSISGKVFMGDQMITLYMIDNPKENLKESFIDFKDTSAPVIIKVFFRIFASHRAVYNIDDVIAAVREKMDAGMRAYFGKMNLDKALATRANTSFRTIIKSNAVGADILKEWGVEIKGIAVTDIDLPAEIKKFRQLIIEATKKRDVAEIGVETSKHEALSREEGGAAIGKEIKKASELSGLPIDTIRKFLEFMAYCKALEGKGTVITDSKGPSALGAEIAAGAEEVRNLGGEKNESD